MTEQWRSVRGVLVSTLGRVRALPSFDPVEPHRDSSFRLAVRCEDGTDCALAVLVLEAFGRRRPDAAEVAFLNGSPDDFRFDNLRWHVAPDKRVQRKRRTTISDALLSQAKVAIAAGEKYRVIAMRLGVSTAWLSMVARGVIRR